MDDMIELSVGCTWDLAQLSSAEELNASSANGTRVAEFYGSLQSTRLSLPSARPDFRLPDVDWEHFARFVKAASRAHIDVNYTCNATRQVSVADTWRNRNMHAEAFRKLETVGVARLTLADPLLIEIALQSCRLPIDVSTVMHPAMISQLPYYEEWRADRVCMSLYRNRDISFLQRFASAAGAYNISPVLMVNEFCMFGEATCLGLLRDACYAHSSLGGNPEELFDGWPFSRCHAQRIARPHSWLQAPFILPQHLPLYSELTGITRFKVTGRTFPVDHIMRITRWYVLGTFDNAIAHLWVDPGNPKVNSILQSCDVRPTELADVRFFDRWFVDRHPCDFSCGISCDYCVQKHNEIMKVRSDNE